MVFCMPFTFRVLISVTIADIVLLVFLLIFDILF